MAGKIASHPALIRFGERIAEEGGADVAGWASGRGVRCAAGWDGQGSR